MSLGRRAFARRTECSSARSNTTDAPFLRLPRVPTFGGPVMSRTTLRGEIVNGSSSLRPAVDPAGQTVTRARAKATAGTSRNRPPGKRYASSLAMSVPAASYRSTRTWSLPGTAACAVPSISRDPASPVTVNGTGRP